VPLLYLAECGRKRHLGGKGGKMIEKINLQPGDPKLEFKKKACDLLKIETTGPEESDLIDLSCLTDICEETLKLVPLGKRVLLPPLALLSDCIEKLADKNVLIAFPLREWALANKIVKMKNDDICGELTSARITWTRPKKESASEQEFLFNTVAGLVDLACCITETPIEQLYIEKVEGENNIFGLMMFGGEIAIELEANESLPDSMEATHFIKANFTDGIITNAPLVGHFNEEGSIIATDEKCERWLSENSDWEGGNEMENTYWQMLLAIKEGLYSSDIQHSRKIVQAIRNTVTNNMPVNFGTVQAPH
jgi:hypothetical protein